MVKCYPGQPGRDGQLRPGISGTKRLRPILARQPEQYLCGQLAGESWTRPGKVEADWRLTRVPKLPPAQHESGQPDAPDWRGEVFLSPASHHSLTNGAKLGWYFEGVNSINSYSAT